jgi:hypothetical protein
MTQFDHGAAILKVNSNRFVNDLGGLAQVTEVSGEGIPHLDVRLVLSAP